jgi:hypothetical protein
LETATSAPRKRGSAWQF